MIGLVFATLVFAAAAFVRLKMWDRGVLYRLSPVAVASMLWYILQVVFDSEAYDYQTFSPWATALFYIIPALAAGYNWDKKWKALIILAVFYGWPIWFPIVGVWAGVLIGLSLLGALPFVGWIFKIFAGGMRAAHKPVAGAIRKKWEGEKPRRGTWSAKEEADFRALEARRRAENGTPSWTEEDENEYQDLRQIRIRTRASRA